MASVQPLYQNIFRAIPKIIITLQIATFGLLKQDAVNVERPYDGAIVTFVPKYTIAILLKAQVEVVGQEAPGT